MGDSTFCEMAQTAQRILVTGGNAGIGLELCRHLVESGCSVIVGSRDLARGQAAIESLALPAAAAARCSIVQLDVASADSVSAAAATVKEMLGDTRLYGLVNNAGAGGNQQTELNPQIIVDVNLYGTKRVTEAFLPFLEQQGRVVNLGSGAAGGYVNKLGETDAARTMIKDDITFDEIVAHLEEHLGGDADGMGGYGPSKAALGQYTKICARENPSFVFSCCSPGFINTAMTQGWGASKAPSEAVPVLLKMLFGQLEASGWYYGSDGERSPYHFMRNPGDKVYDGVMPF